MMIRITDTPKPRDRFGSIPIRDDKSKHSSSPGPYPPRRPKRSSLWTWLKRIVALPLGLALLVGLASPLLVPYLATSLFAQHLAAVLNRPVTIARGEFNPLTCTLTLHQIIAGPKLSQPDDPVDPFFSAGRISIHLVPERLLEGELSCNLDVEHFFLHLVRRQDGGYNLGQDMDEVLAGTPVFPLRFFCNRIAADNSRIIFDDAQTGKTHLAEEISLTIFPGRTNPITLQAKINDTPITQPDAASPPPDSAQAANPLPAQPEPAETEGNAGFPPAAPDDPAVKRAEGMALVQELTQAVRHYLQPPVIPKGEGRTENPLTP